MAPAAELIATMRLALAEGAHGLKMIAIDTAAEIAAAHSEQANRELLDLLRAGLDGWDSSDIERVEKATGCTVDDASALALAKLGDSLAYCSHCGVSFPYVAGTPSQNEAGLKLAAHARICDKNPLVAELREAKTHLQALLDSVKVNDREALVALAAARAFLR